MRELDVDTTVFLNDLIRIRGKVEKLPDSQFEYSMWVSVNESGVCTACLLGADFIENITGEDLNAVARASLNASNKNWYYYTEYGPVVKYLSNYLFEYLTIDLQGDDWVTRRRALDALNGVIDALRGEKMDIDADYMYDAAYNRTETQLGVS